MAIRNRLNHVAAGLLDAFYSRCNELDGFWALGMLYREVQEAPHLVKLDLLARTATPAGPGADSIAARYADFLGKALSKKNLRAEDLTQARVTIQFKADVPGWRFQPHWIGDPFICTVTLRRSNDESIYTGFGKCLPTMHRCSGEAVANISCDTTMGKVGKSVDVHGKPVAASKYMPSRNQLLLTWFLLGVLPAQAIPPPPPAPRLLRKAMMTVAVRLIEANHGRVSKISELCKVRGKIPVYADEGNAAGANGWDIPGCRMPRDGENLNVHVSGAKAISKDFTAYATASVAVVKPDAVPLCSICGPQPLAVSSAEIRVSGSHRSMKFSLNANPVSILNAKPTVWLEAHVEIID